jgi:hypothetical protein
MGSYKDKILGLQVPNWRGKQFIPYISLHQLLQNQVRQIIEEVVQDGGIAVYHKEEAIRAVLHGGYRMLGILILMDKIPMLLSFAKADDLIDKPLDSGLPYAENKLEEILGDDYRRFFDHQWSFSAPIFERSLLHRNLHKRTILPFMTMTPIGDGGFGNVFRVTVPGPHQRIEGSNVTEVKLSPLSNLLISS